eukprot:9103062-Pyramimonas_sp.AAC.1
MFLGAGRNRRHTSGKGRGRRGHPKYANGKNHGVPHMSQHNIHDASAPKVMEEAGVRHASGSDGIHHTVCYLGVAFSRPCRRLRLNHSCSFHGCQ